MYDTFHIISYHFMPRPCWCLVLCRHFDPKFAIWSAPLRTATALWRPDQRGASIPKSTKIDDILYLSCIHQNQLRCAHDAHVAGKPFVSSTWGANTYVRLGISLEGRILKEWAVRRQSPALRAESPATPGSNDQWYHAISIYFNPFHP